MLVYAGCMFKLVWFNSRYQNLVLFSSIVIFHRMCTNITDVLFWEGTVYPSGVVKITHSFLLGLFFRYCLFCVLLTCLTFLCLGILSSRYQFNFDFRVLNLSLVFSANFSLSIQKAFLTIRQSFFRLRGTTNKLWIETWHIIAFRSIYKNN